MRYTDKKKSTDNQKKVYTYLIDRGFEPHHASAVVGNLMQESYAHLDSTIENSIGAVGIAQWLGPRRKDLENYAKKQGKSFKDFDLQLEFLHKELTSTGNSWGTKAMNAFYDTETTEEAAAAFVDKFERSGEKPGDKGFDNRINNAKKVYLQFNDTNTYGKDENGNTVSINPETATEEQLTESPKVKAEFYNRNFGVIEQKFEDEVKDIPAKEKEAKEEIVENVKESIADPGKEKFYKEALRINMAEYEDTPHEDEPLTANQNNPYDIDISVDGNEFFDFFIPEMQTGGETSTPEQIAAESRDFVKDWFDNSITKARYSANTGQGFRDSLPEIKSGLDQIDKTTINHNGESDNPAAGASYKDNEITFYKPATQETATHEYTHALGIDDKMTAYMKQQFGTPAAAIQQNTGKPFREAIAEKFNIDDSTSFGKQKVQNTVEHSRYMSSRGELYPRIMEMRKVLNVVPGEVIDDSHIEKLKASTDNPLFKYYNDEQLKEMLNTLASNNGTDESGYGLT